MDSSIVGIGKLKVFPSKDFEDEIPILSFIVKKRDNLYVSICLQLQIEGYGIDPDEAKDNMKNTCFEFLRKNAEADTKVRWNNLKELFMIDEINLPLWNEYREAQIYLAQKGISSAQIYLAQKGISSDLTTRYIDKINALEKEIADLKTEKEKCAIGSSSMNCEIIDYKRIA